MRLANYVQTLRRDLVKVAEACGVEHPRLIGTDSVKILEGRTGSSDLQEVYDHRGGWGLPSETDRAEIVRIMTAVKPQGASGTPSDTAVG